jgi:hypothetical protein
MGLIVCLNIFLAIIGIGLLYIFYSSLIRIRNASESIAQSLEVMARNSATMYGESEE